MTTTDAGLRIEYFKDISTACVLCRAVFFELDSRRRLSGARYLIRFGRWTIYHGGNGSLYEGLADRLRPLQRERSALLPVGGENFSPAAAAHLAADIEQSGWSPIPRSPPSSNTC